MNAQLLSVPWLSVKAIDLRPCLPSIEKADFLSLTPSAEYDVVVCAMVLNCVPTATDRGTMLLKMRAYLKSSGHAFIVLPLRCLNDSPFMTTAYFDQALAAAGFEVGMPLELCSMTSAVDICWSGINSYSCLLACSLYVLETN